MIKTGAILLAFLAFASAAKAENVIYTGSRDIVVDLSVLGADEEIKLQTEEVFLPAPVVPEESKASAESKMVAEPKASAKPEKIILKKPPFTYKKPFKARKPKTPSTVPAAASAPAPVTKTKKEAKKEAKQDAQTQAIAEAKKEIKSEAKKEVKSEVKDIALVTALADEKKPEAVELLAWMNATGTGVEQNFYNAWFLYTEADDLGVKEAKRNAAVIYNLITFQRSKK